MPQNTQLHNLFSFFKTLTKLVFRISEKGMSGLDIVLVSTQILLMLNIFNLRMPRA
jgi:hypothetical protein